jgi:tetratricopeptide (TPR) repeat protein
MKKAFVLTGLALLASAGTAAAAPPAPAPAPPPPAAPALATPPAAPPTAAEIEASRQIVAGADVERMLRDRAYAAGLLAHIDRLAPLAEGNPEARLAIENLRLFALITQERPDDVRAGVDALLAERPTDGAQYAGAWYGALSIEDLDRALAVVETSSRNVPGVHWAELRRMFEIETIGQLLQRFHQAHQEEKRVRLAQALFRIGWNGGGDTEMSDFIRSILVEDRLRQHDAGAAADYAAGITTPAQMLPMIVQTRFDPVLPAGRDRLDLLRESLAQRDRATAEALAAAPQDVRAALDRIQYLRGLGRDADALALAMPFTRDVRATVAAGREGMWVINEAAYTLATLGRGDEAVALMRRLLALPIADNAALIGPFINQAEVLNGVGRYGEALEHARMLERDDARYANDYGKMWISSATVCALAGLNRTAEAAPVLERMRAQSEVNPAALTRAYLCAGDEDAAAALLVHRLESDDSESAVLALQDYALDHETGQDARLLERLTAIRARPAVRDALGRVGHMLTLPLARTYWGGF